MDSSAKKFDLEIKQKLPLSDIFQRELCTGCGACEAICSKKILNLNYSVKKGLYFVEILPGGFEKCTGCGMCRQVCPAVKIVDPEFIHPPLNKKQEILEWLVGTYKKIYVGNAIHKDLRYQCSSGGLATTILLYQLRTRQINAALLAKPMAQDATRHEINLAASEDEIIKNRGTVYCQLNYSKAWKHITNPAGKMAIIGQPCHLKAIDLFSSIKRLDKLKLFRIGLFCGGTSSHLALNFLCRRKNVSPENISHLRYRSGGWPGRRMVAGVRRNNKSGSNNEKILFDRDSSLLHSYLYRCCFSGSFFPDVCLACKDQTAEGADISLGDAWLPRFVSSDKFGTNIIICRTDRAKSLLDQMVRENLISLEEATPEDIIISQGNCLVGKKTGAWANHMQTNTIEEQAMKNINKFFYDYLPNKEMLLERRLYRWLGKNLPGAASFFVFVAYNLLINVVRIFYSAFGAYRDK